MTYQSSYFISTSSGTTAIDGSSVSSATYTTTVQAASPDDSDGLAASLGGEAVAAGEDTVAAGSISAVIEGNGNVTSVQGSATMVAASESSGDDVAIATADTFAAVSDGAELTFTFNQEKDSSTKSDAGSAATSFSSTTISAYDISPEVGGGGSLGQPPESEEDPPGIAPDTAADDDSDSSGLDGNFAFLEFNAWAFGDDSFVLVDAFVLTVDDELSVVAGFVDVAVD